MKKLTIFETSIVGFFVGVIISTYLAFLTSTGGYIGEFISLISLKPLLGILQSYENGSLLIQFVFVIAVFTIYGVIVGMAMKKYSKAGIVVTVIALLMVIGGSFEQVRGAASHTSSALDPMSVVATAIVATPRNVSAEPKQYFGNEVVGDLNGDKKDDVAFLIVRNDSDRGILYYLVASLAFEGGHVGTNLIFVGEKLDPQKISIDNGLIGLEYMSIREEASTSTSMLYARVSDGILEKTEKVVEAPVAIESASTSPAVQ